MSEETIFATALEKPPSERADFITQACGDDEALRNRVAALLTASEKVGDFMAKPAVASAVECHATEALSEAAAAATADRRATAAEVDGGVSTLIRLRSSPPKWMMTWSPSTKHSIV